MNSESERRSVLVFAAACTAMLVALVVPSVFIPYPVAPVVRVRWAAEIDDVERARLETRFRLAAAEHREGTTWSYELLDPSPANVTVLVSDPAVADTHYIDRTRRVVADDAPEGRTSTLPGPLGWLRSDIRNWAAVFCSVSLVVSLIWLLTSRRIARR
jgi:hypothetical protein